MSEGRSGHGMSRQLKVYGVAKGYRLPNPPKLLLIWAFPEFVDVNIFALSIKSSCNAAGRASCGGEIVTLVKLALSSIACDQGQKSYSTAYPYRIICAFSKPGRQRQNQK